MHDYGLGRLRLWADLLNRQRHTQQHRIIHYNSRLSSITTDPVTNGVAVLHIVKQVADLHRIFQSNRSPVGRNSVVIRTARQVQGKTLKVQHKRRQRFIYGEREEEEALFESCNSMSGGSNEWK